MRVGLCVRMIVSGSVIILWGCASRLAPVSIPMPAAPGNAPVQASRAGNKGIPPASSPVVEPGGILTLRDAMALAMAGNPELAAASWDVRASEAGARQAGLLPNPELEFGADEFGGATARRGWGTAELSLRLSQVIELGGKRAARMREASLEHALSTWDREVKRLDTLAGVTTAFIDALAAQEMAGLAGETAGLAESFSAMAAERVRAGKAPPLEEMRARVALTGELLKKDRAARMLDAARNRLAASWGGQSPEFVSVTGPLDSIVPPEAAPDLDRVLSRSPEMERWVVRMERSAAAVKAEKAKRIPDLAVSAGATRFRIDDETAMVLGVAVPLPLFDRNTWNIRRSEHLLARAREERRAEYVEARQSLANAFLELASAYGEADALTREVIPAARTAYDQAREGYAAGKFSSLDVLEAQRMYFAARERGVETLAAYHTAVAGIERMTGAPLEELTPINRQGMRRGPVHP